MSLLCHVSETSSLGSWDAAGMRVRRSLVRWDSSGSGDQSPFSLACPGELCFLRSLPWRWDFESSGIARPVLAFRESCCTSQEVVAVRKKASGFFCALGRCALSCVDALGAPELLPGWMAWRVCWFGRGLHLGQSSQLTWIRSYGIRY